MKPRPRSTRQARETERASWSAALHSWRPRCAGGASGAQASEKLKGDAQRSTSTHSARLAWPFVVLRRRVSPNRTFLADARCYSRRSAAIDGFRPYIGNGSWLCASSHEPDGPRTLPFVSIERRSIEQLRRHFGHSARPDRRRYWSRLLPLPPSVLCRSAELFC